MLYARVALKALAKDHFIQKNYHLLTDDDEVIPNPVWESNSLSLMMPLPIDIKPADVDTYIRSHSKILMDMMIGTNLYGIVNYSAKTFDNSEITSDGDKLTQSVVVLAYRPKYIPVLITSVIWSIILTLIFITISHYGFIKI